MRDHDGETFWGVRSIEQELDIHSESAIYRDILAKKVSTYLQKGYRKQPDQPKMQITKVMLTLRQMMSKSKFRRVWNGLGRLNQNWTIWVDLELRTIDRTTAALYRTHLYLNEKKHSAYATSSPRFPSSSSCAFTEATDYLVLVMDDLQEMTGFMPGCIHSFLDPFYWLFCGISLLYLACCLSAIITFFTYCQKDKWDLDKNKRSTHLKKSLFAYPMRLTAPAYLRWWSHLST